MQDKLWKWYLENLIPIEIATAILFGWQVWHLYWLTGHVVAERVLGYSVFNPGELYQLFLVTADYFEIPALISGTILYLGLLRHKFSRKNLIYIFLINIQWLHIFWITDEFVVAHFANLYPNFPHWLAWFAIFIDYLELPIIYETVKMTIKRVLSVSPVGKGGINSRQ